MTAADEWVRGFRDVAHAQQDTTVAPSACEGYHSAIKGNELAKKSRLQGRRVDWLLYLLWTEVCYCTMYAVSCNALMVVQVYLKHPNCEC